MVIDKFKKSMSKDAYLRIKKEIYNNELVPGERLIEMDIAERYKFSRTPVREALLQLADEGIVDNYPRKGAMVSKISIKNSIEMFEIRRELEGYALTQIAQADREKDMQQMEDLIAELDNAIESQDYELVRELQRRWCKLIVSLIKSKILKEYMTAIHEPMPRLIETSLLGKERTLKGADEIKAIFEAIKLKDEDLIRHRSREHLTNTMQSFMDNVDYKTYKK